MPACDKIWNFLLNTMFLKNKECLAKMTMKESYFIWILLFKVTNAKMGLNPFSTSDFTLFFLCELLQVFSQYSKEGFESLFSLRFYSVLIIFPNLFIMPTI